MEAIKFQQVIEKDSEIFLQNIPCKKGQHVEVIVLINQEEKIDSNKSTTRSILDSGIIGLWKNRDDISDSVTYARNLREQAQRRDI